MINRELEFLVCAECDQFRYALVSVTMPMAFTPISSPLSACYPICVRRAVAFGCSMPPTTLCPRMRYDRTGSLCPSMKRYNLCPKTNIMPDP
jgi:hypothetical protein